MRKILTIFERKFDSFCEKIWQFFQENPPSFTGKFNVFSRKLTQFLHESLTVFTGTFDDFSGKLDDFCSEICWFLFSASRRVFYHNNSHQSKTRQILRQKSSNFLVKTAKFVCKHRQIFLQLPTVKFLSKNYQPSTQKLSTFFCQNLQIFQQNLSDFRKKKKTSNLIFLQISLNFYTKIVKFFYKDYQLFLPKSLYFLAKRIEFSKKNRQIFL